MPFLTAEDEEKKNHKTDTKRAFDVMRERDTDPAFFLFCFFIFYFPLFDATILDRKDKPPLGIFSFQLVQLGALFLFYKKPRHRLRVEREDTREEESFTDFSSRQYPTAISKDEKISGGFTYYIFHS